MLPRQNHGVVLASRLGGDVMADAMKFTATDSSTARTATWVLLVPSMQTYDVYATWVPVGIDKFTSSV